MPDWSKIKTEYITDPDASYRDLSQKYGVHYTNIAKRASKEGWQQLRKQQATETQTKMVEAVERGKIDRAAKLLDASDLLLRKVVERIEAVDALKIGSQELRHLSATIRDLKEIQMIRSELDIREQEERIEKLRREAQQEQNREPIQVIIGDGLEDYTQ